MQMRTFLLLLCLLAGAVTELAAAEQGGRGELYVFGKAAFSGDNQAAARKSAISDALEGGVGIALIERLEEAQLSSGFERVVRDLLPSASDFVAGYTLLQEARSDGMLHVLVKVRINDGMLLKAINDAGLMREEDAPLKVLFMVAEQRAAEPVYWWKDPAAQPPLNTTEILLHQAFQDLGYDPLNRMTAFAGKEVSGQMRSSVLEEADIHRWGALFGAELVVYGRSEIRAADQVLLDLTVHDVQKGLRLAEARVSERIGGTEDADQTDLAALDKAVQKAVGTLQHKLTSSFGGAAVEMRSFEVSLTGFSSYAEVNGFRSFLSSGVPGVQSVAPSRAGRDSVSYVVRFRGDGAQLLSAVLQGPNRPYPLGGEMRSEGQLVFTVRPSGGR